jgi:predicted lipoprotein with Yx(FWY)xxD motif
MRQHPEPRTMPRGACTSLLVSLLAMVTVSSCSRGDLPAAGAAGRGATGDPGAATARAATSTAPTSASAAASGPASTPAVRVTVVSSSDHGPILADGNGRALYLLESDAAGESGCTEMCAVIWPAYLAPAGTSPTADSGVQASLLGTAARRGGGAQVSYAGHALYYYLGDSRPGDTRGQRVEDSWGEWYLVHPDGREASPAGRELGGRRGRDQRRDDR